MKLLYTGFTHKTTGVRLYSFEGVVSQGIHKGFLVSADVSLLTKHHIQIQEGPMMCLRLLESSPETELPLETELPAEILVLTEADMLTHVCASAAEKAAKKRAKRRFSPVNGVARGMTWRSSPPR